MIMGKKLRKENDVSAFGESQTPFTFPTVSSNQKENEKKSAVRQNKPAAFSHLILDYISLNAFLLSVAALQRGFFFSFLCFFSDVPLLYRFSWLHYLLIILFSCSLCFSYVCKIRACFHVASTSFAFVNSNSHI